ncbi:MAG: DnaJ domain-containing protein [Oscillospiraceae bacterium]|nr:DnaJ domain-containing protein [Oscillospiraceae bacterium]
MKDPYSVLGVSSNASTDEVKRAYRELAKKYHPDNYINNPLADLAEEKMKEINEAYDAIIKGRTSSSSYGGNTSSSYSNYSGSKYAAVCQAIYENNIALAEKLLSESPVHDAEWNFLMGSVMVKKGWFDNARSYFAKAYSMEPNNREYAEALNRMRYSGSGANMGGAMLTPCDCCTGLMCADCLCDCC